MVCCKRGAQDAMTALRTIMQRLKLTVNEEKTHMCQKIPQERFDFLDYTIGRCYSRKDGHAYIGTRSSKKSIKPGVGVRSPNYPVNGRPDPNFPPA